MEQLVPDAVVVIDQVAGGGPVHVVGHDWGAAIAWSLAARHPRKVQSLTALSVPHPAAFLGSLLTSSQGLRSWYMYLFQLPWLPEHMARSQLAAAWLIRNGQHPTRARRDVARLRQPGAATGPLNYYRAMPLTGPGEARRRVRRPTLFVWSDGDTAITAAAARRCGRWVSTATYRFHTLTAVSHWIPQEAPEALAKLLVPHLHRNAEPLGTAARAAPSEEGP